MDRRTTHTNGASGRLSASPLAVPLLAACWLLTGALIRPGFAQSPPPPGRSTTGGAAALVPRRLDIRSYGLDVPPGVVGQARDDERVLTADERGQACVARVHVHLGDYRIVLLPDGQLVARQRVDAPPTDRPFEPLSEEQLSERLLKQFPGFKAWPTRRYLFIYNTSEEFRVATTRIMETMLDGVLKYVRARGLPAEAPEVPLVVIMFRTEREFQQFKQMPEGILAYYNALTNQVVLREESPLMRVQRDLAIQQALSTIAHEGAHQILHNIGVQQRMSVWPMWLSEGLAEYLAPTSTGRRSRWKGAGVVNDLRMFELERYLKARSAQQASGRLVEHTLGASRLDSTGYAAAWSLVHYLAKTEPDKFDQYLAAMSRRGPLEGNEVPTPEGVMTGQLQQFQSHFTTDFADLEARLVKYLGRLPYQAPFAEWPHFAVLVRVPDGKRYRALANTFHTRTLASQWLNDQLQLIEPAQRGAVQSTIREFPNRLTAERYTNQWLRGQ